MESVTFRSLTNDSDPVATGASQAAVMPHICSYFSELIETRVTLWLAEMKRVYTSTPQLRGHYLSTNLTNYNKMYGAYGKVLQLVHILDVNRIAFEHIKQKAKSNRTLETASIEEAAANAESYYREAQTIAENFRSKLLTYQWTIQNGGKEPWAFNFGHWVLGTQPCKLQSLNGKIVAVANPEASDVKLVAEHLKSLAQKAFTYPPYTFTIPRAPALTPS